MKKIKNLALIDDDDIFVFLTKKAIQNLQDMNSRNLTPDTGVAKLKEE